MQTSKELFNQLSDLWDEFESNHKVNPKRVITLPGGKFGAIGEIKKLVTEYRNLQ